MPEQRDSSPHAFPIYSPTGVEITIPIEVDWTSDPYLRLTRPAGIKQYYEQHGYVVVRKLIPPRLCDVAREAFVQEVKPFDGFLYRQTTANPEKHQFNEHGFVLNAILNLQDLNRAHFPRFRAAGLAVITHAGLHDVANALLGEEGVVVQSMYFEGNPVTPAHQDTYYLDSVDVGRMVAAWIALEDIRPGAGRFFVYPGSHLLDMQKNGGDVGIAFQHERYKRLVRDIIAHQQLECQAPAMSKGDVLFSSSKTIHGSLSTTQEGYSRTSLTTHIIPRSKGLLQFQSREKPLRLQEINGIPVHCPKDQNRLLNRAILFVETSFPGIFQVTKKMAIKLMTHRVPAAVDAGFDGRA
jgi:phytanoyl-CoA hydroxylase